MKPTIAFKLIIVNLLLFVNLCLYAQSQPIQTFNKIFNFADASISQTVRGISNIDEKLFIYGNVYHENYSEMIIAKSDLEVDSITIIKHLGFVGDEYMISKIINTEDNNMLMTGRHIFKESDTTYSEMFLIKLSLDGEVIWNKTYNIENYNERWVSGVTLVEAKDNGFLIVGGSSIMGVVIKTDYLGNKEWQYTIGNNTTSNYVYLRSCLVLPDSGFLIGGHNFNGHDYYAGTAYLCKINKSGEFEWGKSLGGPYKDRGTYLNFSNDGLIIGSYQYTSDITYWGEDTETKIAVFKMNLDGEILWEKRYGTIGESYKINSINELNNKNLLISGSTKYLEYGWLFQTTSIGDSIKFSSFEPENNIYYMYGFSGSLPLLDESIISFGYANKIDSASSTGISNGWLVKTDLNGCLNNISVLSQPGNIEAYNGDTLDLKLETYCNVNVDYQWFKDSAEIFNASNSILHLLNITSVDEGEYYCRISNSCETIYSDAFNININYYGISDNSLYNKPKYIITPNPVNNYLKIQPQLTINEKVEIKIISITGVISTSLVSTFNKENCIEINTSYLNSGIYFLQIIGKENYGVVKFVKK